MPAEMAKAMMRGPAGLMPIDVAAGLAAPQRVEEPPGRAPRRR